MEVLTTTLEPTLTDSVLRWNPPEGYRVVDSTPKNLNSLYAGITSTAYAFLQRSPETENVSIASTTRGSATITGKICGEQVEIPVDQAELPSMTSQQSKAFSSILLRSALWSKLNDLETQAFSNSRKNSQNDQKLQEPPAKRPKLNGMACDTLFDNASKQNDATTQEQLVRLSVDSHIPCGLTHFRSRGTHQTMIQILPYKQNSSSKSSMKSSQVPVSKSQMLRRSDRKRVRSQFKGKNSTQLSFASLAKSTLTAMGSTLKSVVSSVTFGIGYSDSSQSMEIGQTIDAELEYQKMKDSRLYWNDSEGGKLVYPPMYYQSRDSSKKNKQLHPSIGRPHRKVTKHNLNGTSPVPLPINGITPSSSCLSEQAPVQSTVIEPNACGGEDDFTISDTESDSSVDPDWGDLRRPREILPLIHMQLFDGAWPMVRAFSYAVGVPLDEIRKLPVFLKDSRSTLQSVLPSHPSAPNQPNQDDSDKANFWCTALALACFEEYFPHLRPEWELIAFKGRFWLEQNLHHCQLTYTDIHQIAKELVLRKS